jgi:hypothetical protein
MCGRLDVRSRSNYVMDKSKPIDQISVVLFGGDIFRGGIK